MTHRTKMRICWTVFIVSWLGCVASILLFMPGCVPQTRESTLEQRQRETITASTTTDVVDNSIYGPTPMKFEVPQVRGDPIKFEIPPSVQADRAVATKAVEASDSQAWGLSRSKVSLPLSVAILIAGIGLSIFAVLFWLLLKKSAAVRAAWSYGNDALAGVITNIRSHAQSTTDPQAAATLSSLAATAEGARAELNKPL